jgi:hypothetical protein
VDDLHNNSLPFSEFASLAGGKVPSNASVHSLLGKMSSKVAGFLWNSKCHSS